MNVAAGRATALALVGCAGRTWTDPQPAPERGVQVRLRSEGLSPTPPFEFAWAIDLAPGSTDRLAGRVWGSGTTDSRGDCAIEPPEEALKSDKAHLWVWIRTEDRWRNVIDIAFGSQVRNVDAVIPEQPPARCLRVRALDPDGRPLTEAALRLVMHYEAGPDPFQPVFTADREGLIQARSLGFEGYAADLSAPGFAPVRFVTRLVDPGDDWSDEVTLFPARTVLVDVIDVSGRPVAHPTLTDQYQTRGLNDSAAWRAEPAAGSTYCLVVPSGQDAYAEISAPSHRRRSVKLPPTLAHVVVAMERDLQSEDAVAPSGLGSLSASHAR